MRALPRHVAGLFLAAVVLASPHAASPAWGAPDFASAKAFLLDGVARANAILRAHDAPRAEVAEKLRAELHRGFDVPAIAGFVLGPASRTLTAEQRRRYMSAFEELIVQTFANYVAQFGPRIEGDIHDIIRVTGATPVAGDQLLLHSQINRKGAEWVKVDWRLRERDGRILIVDIMVLGVSQIQVFRSEFASVMNRSGRGVEGLIDALDRQTKALVDAR